MLRLRIEEWREGAKGIVRYDEEGSECVYNELFFGREMVREGGEAGGRGGID